MKSQAYKFKVIAKATLYYSVSLLCYFCVIYYLHSAFTHNSE